MDSPANVPIGRPEGAESIKVLVRVRPLNQTELAENNDSVVSILNDQSLNVTSADGKKSFRCSFDSVLGPTSTQSEVYSIVRNCTESVIDGFNSTIFAYGQTGSGKTHSMYGPPNYASAGGNVRDPRNADMMGLIPRAVDEIFELVNNRSITDFQVHCSFVQIYNENLYDMLRDSSMNTPLSIRDNNKEIYVQGLSEYNVKSVADTLQLLKIAEENRAIRETNMNMFSSRSHSIFQIQVEHKKVAEDGGEITYKAKFNLVDLAGSEKWNTKLHMRDEHIAEMTNINLSLHTLGKCISALAQASHKQSHHRESESRSATREREREASVERSMGSLDHSGSTAGSMKDFPVPKSGRYSGMANNKEPTMHVPFRESKLTRLLQDSLGGNAKTFLIATVSPARANSEESISTLKFADRAKQVMVQAVINETRPVDYALVKRLQQEVEMLKSLLKRVVQSQGGINGANGAVAGSPGQFQAKLKQATTTSDFQDLFTSPMQSYASGASSPMMHLSSSYAGGVASTEGAGGGAGPAQHRQAGQSGDAPAGGGLEYVISLEKALNQEQIHSQHLNKKNETLIKELEELKFQNLQLTQGGSGGGNPGLNRASSFIAPPLTKSISINSLAITTAQVNQVITSVQGLLGENAKLLEQSEQVQKIMKKFFKFQIEEEDMKAKMEGVFAAVKDIKASSAAGSVVDNFAFLEFLATKVSTSSSGANAQGSPAKARESTPPLYTQNAQHTPDVLGNLHSSGAGVSGVSSVAHGGQAGRKQLRRANEPPGGQLTPMGQSHTASVVHNDRYGHLNQQQQGLAHSKSAGAGAGKNITPLRQSHHQPHNTLPSLGHEVDAVSTNVKSSSHRANQRRDNFSAGSDDGYLGQAEEDFSQFHLNTVPSASTHHHPQAHSFQHPNPHTSHVHSAPSSHHAHNNTSNHAHNPSFGPTPSQYAPPQPMANLSYRVRGGPGPLSNSSANSLQSSGGWVVPAEEDAAVAEEMLKQELKKAKKKIKKQQKMQEWQRIKEEKQKADQEAEAAQRAAEEEAELQKELKRKQYAQKAKSKLDAYYTKVKTEAEKIQELKNLGIDPSSLF